MTKPGIESTNLEELFQALGSSDADIRYQALVEAMSLAPEQIAELVRLSEREHRRNTGSICACLVMGSGLIGGALAFAPNNGIWVFLGTVVWLLFFHAACMRAVPARQCQDENLVRVLENAPAAGSVASALQWLGSARGRPQRRIAGVFRSLQIPLQERHRERLHHILLRRLPELQLEDAQEWTSQQKEPILLILRAWHQNTALATALLKAMPEIGGTWALETVERLAKLKHWDPDRLRANYKNVRIQSLPWQVSLEDGREPTPQDVEDMLAAFRLIGVVASECLPGLRAKIQDESAARLLLRAAELPPHTEELLRPAGDEGAQPDTVNLLRPGIPQEEGLTIRR